MAQLRWYAHSDAEFVGRAVYHAGRPLIVELRAARTFGGPKGVSGPEGVRLVAKRAAHLYFRTGPSLALEDLVVAFVLAPRGVQGYVVATPEACYTLHVAPSAQEAFRGQQAPLAHARATAALYEAVSRTDGSFEDLARRAHELGVVLQCVLGAPPATNNKLIPECLAALEATVAELEIEEAAGRAELVAAVAEDEGKGAAVVEVVIDVKEGSSESAVAAPALSSALAGLLPPKSDAQPGGASGSLSRCSSQSGEREPLPLSPIEA